MSEQWRTDLERLRECYPTTAALAEAAGTLQLTTDSDSWLHSLWHVLGAAAAGTALYLV